MTEAKVQHFLESNIRNILDVCVNFQNSYILRPKLKLSNNIETDLGILDVSERVVAIFESKGNVGINELVRGIGQVAQYQKHIEERMLYDYIPSARAFLVIPLEVYQNFDFRKLSFPKRASIILIDEKNDSFALLPKKKILSQKFKNIAIVSSYYIRDNRLGEIYLGLKLIEARSPKCEGKVDMKWIKNELKKLIINKGNDRNIPITLHGLGFIDYENRLTAEGQRHLRMDYYEFCKSLANNQIMPFLMLTMLILMKVAGKRDQDISKIITNPTEIKKEIIKIFNGKDVLYVTDSGTRYISSWLNILRDDLGAISFEAGNYAKGIKINYFPFRGSPFLMNQMPIRSDCRKEDYVFKGLKAIMKL